MKSLKAFAIFNPHHHPHLSNNLQCDRRGELDDEEGQHVDRKAEESGQQKQRQIVQDDALCMLINHLLPLHV